MVQTETAAPLTGSIADVTARLALWGRRAPKGLARVEFISDFSRREVVSELRATLPQHISFHEIELPFQKPAVEVVRFLREHLRELPLGIVSITGFATAFFEDGPLEDSLRALNFHRESLAQFPLCQIWWMTHPFADNFLRSVPDLDSWFILRLRLAEVIVTKRQENFQPEIIDGKLHDLNEVRRQSSDYVVRLEKAIALQSSAEELIMLAGVAANVLHNAGLEKEEQELLPILLESIAPTLVRDQLIDAVSNMPNPSVVTAEISGPRISSPSITLRVLAQMFERSGKLNEAESFYLASLRAAENSNDSWFSELDIAYHLLAEFYVSHHRYYEAETVCKQWLDVQERSSGTINQHVIYALSTLVTISLLLNKYAEVEQLYNRLQLLAKNDQVPEPIVVQLLEDNIINLYKRLGRFLEAEAVSRRAFKSSDAT